MSSVYNYGEISLSKSLTKEQADKVNAMLYEDLVTEGESKILFEEYSEKYLEDELSSIIKEVFVPSGIIANGEVEYYGDFDGKIYVKDNEVDSCDAEWIHFYEASLKELLDRCEESGYPVRAVITNLISMIAESGSYNPDDTEFIKMIREAAGISEDMYKEVYIK